MKIATVRFIEICGQSDLLLKSFELICKLQQAVLPIISEGIGFASNRIPFQVLSAEYKSVGYFVW